MKSIYLLLAGVLCIPSLKAQQPGSKVYQELYRPQLHFSPKKYWMNDPNGMVYSKGNYHLFYQYYPNATVWGPMHWGHAVSKDLIHWEELPIALYPDKLGYIFSGSAVVDTKNLSGFGKKGQAPLVAVFTYSNPVMEKQGKNNYQSQGIAYSTDNGKTWTKYAANPVLNNPGITDFRDPKVMWFEAQQKWVMTLATKNRVTFYASKNLKQWTKESEIGETIGAHGGVWECPDLFPLTLNGKTYWVLLVSINPGGPNSGSATQYFIGQFDGHTFKPVDTITRWIDHGPDNYAGVTWSNTGQRKVFLGWMSNWLYADKVPTVNWRSAMTVPRELSLKEVNGKILLASAPVKELQNATATVRTLNNLSVNSPLDLTQRLGTSGKQYILKLKSSLLKDFTLTLKNDQHESLVVGYSSKDKRYYIDRSVAGNKSFSNQFAAKAVVPRFVNEKSFDLILIIDATSAELFADGGISNLTSTFFPKQPLNQISINSKGLIIEKLEFSSLKSIWK